MRRIVLFVFLAACVGGYLRYRSLERQARLVPKITRDLGTVRTIAYRFDYLRRQGLEQYERRWNLACVKGQWQVARPASAGEDYRRDMETFVNIIDEVQRQYSWDDLGDAAAETAHRLTKLREWFAEQSDNREDWECNDEGMLDKLAALGRVAAAWNDCLKELTALKADEVLSGGTPAFDECARTLPDTVGDDAPASGPSLAERIVPLGAGERGDETVRVLVGERRWRNYVLSPDGRRFAYIVKRGNRQHVVVDGEEGPPYEHVWAGMEVGRYGGPMFSADSEHVAYTAKRDDGWHVVVDGEEGPAWTAIQSLTLSPEDARIAYAGLRDGRWRVVVDGQEEPHPYAHTSHLVFSPNGRRLAYHSGDERSFFLVTNGVRGRGYETVYSTGPYFSPDSRRVAHVAKRGADLVVAVDAEEMPGFGSVVPPVMFSPDSRRVAYVANGDPSAGPAVRSGGQRVVIDGEPGPLFDRVTGFTFSEDSEHYLYVGQRGKRGVVVVDGRESPSYDALSAPGPRFSPDSQHVGWAALLDGKMHVVVDGEPGPSWVGGVAGGGPVWSPDSSRMGYVAGRGRQAFAIVDGRESVAYDAIVGNVVFSPDGEHVAYIARRGERWYVVRDRREGTAFEGVASSVPLFSDDSERVAFVAVRGGEKVVVVDGEEHPAFDDVDPASLRFSPDSAHLAYAASEAGWRLVVDGRATKARVAGRTEDLPLEFASATQVSMWGLRVVPSGLVRLEVTLPRTTAMRATGTSED